MGKSGEDINTTHQQKKLDERRSAVLQRQICGVPLPRTNRSKILSTTSQMKIPEETKYLKDKRIKLGGFIPERSSFAKAV